MAPKDFGSHDSICAAKVLPCPAHYVGCTYQCPRKDLSAHTSACPVIPLAPILHSLQGRISALEAELEQQRQKRVKRLAKKAAQRQLGSSPVQVPTTAAVSPSATTPKKEKQKKCTKCRTPFPQSNGLCVACNSAAKAKKQNK